MVEFFRLREESLMDDIFRVFWTDRASDTDTIRKIIKSGFLMNSVYYEIETKNSVAIGHRTTEAPEKRRCCAHARG